MATRPLPTVRTGVLVVSAGLVLTACSSTSSSTPTTSPSSAATSVSSAATPTSSTRREIKSLQFVNPLPDVPIWKEINGCIKSEAVSKGISYTESGPSAAQPADPTVMIQQIQSAVASHKNAIIAFPASAAFGPVLQAAQKAGVLTATLYGDGSPASGATVNAGVDCAQIGEQYVKTIAALPGKHVVGLVTEGPTGVGKSWADGVQAAASKTSNVSVAATVYIGGDASQALPQVSSLLTAHPQIDIVASNSGLMTQGAVAAIKSKGLKGKVSLVVINNANGAVEAVQNGYAVGLYLQDLCDLGKRTVDGLVQASQGQTVPLIQVHAVIAEKSNLQQYLKKGWN